MLGCVYGKNVEKEERKEERKIEGKRSTIYTLSARSMAYESREDATE
jgi:hypothetical protein